jgi:hypothetical protein
MHNGLLFAHVSSDIDVQNFSICIAHTLRHGAQQQHITAKYEHPESQRNASMLRAQADKLCNYKVVL